MPVHLVAENSKDRGGSVVERSEGIVKEDRRGKIGVVSSTRKALTRKEIVVNSIEGISCNE